MPTIKSVSHSSSASWEGAVPSSPIPPVVEELWSGMIVYRTAIDGKEQNAGRSSGSTEARTIGAVSTVDGVSDGAAVWEYGRLQFRTEEGNG